MKTAIAGTAYVGLSNAILLVQHNYVNDLKEATFFNSRIVNDLAQFKQEAYVSVVGIMNDALCFAKTKV